MESATRPRLAPAMRTGEQVSPLELFFDLVFVLAITQCTQLMSTDPTWEGLARGLLALGVLWWSWVGYAWLTSVVDPEEDAVRLVIFAAMAGLLVGALTVPDAFGSRGLAFALAYGVVRAAHIGLFWIASRDQPGLRHSVSGLAISTGIGVGILVTASFLDGPAQGGVWALALALDMGGPLVIDSEGWRLVPAHFAERHGLIVIIALGESIVAIGVGVGAHLSLGQGAAAVIGIALAAAMWWIYFDVVAIVSRQRLERAAPGREQNEMARDSYSLLHFPMVAGIVLVALGMKKTLGHVDEELEPETAFALLGGVALYLLALVGFRYRHVRTLNVRRTVLAGILVGLVPVAVEIPALASVAIVTALVWVLIVVETRGYGEGRGRLRHPELAALAVAALLAGCGGGGGDGGVTGTGGDDKLTGTSGDDVLDAKAGEDVVEAQAGNDEITGGPDADFLYGAEGDDTFLESEDDAVDVHDCGPGKDFVAEPDTRDQLLPSCEEAAWTARPPSDEPYENKIAVKPTIGRGSATFEGTCPDGCAGVVELRTPNDRKRLGKGTFELTAGKPGPIRSSVNRRGEQLMGSGGYFRIVIRSEGINSGFTTYVAR